MKKKIFFQSVFIDVTWEQKNTKIDIIIDTEN
jgi:hypothetical protein